MNAIERARMMAEIIHAAGRESEHDAAPQLKPVQWLEYHPGTGRIGQWVGGRNVVQPSSSAELGLLMDAEHISTHTHHVHAGELRERPPSTVRMQVTPGGVILTGVNKGTVVRVSGAGAMQIEQDASDGVIHLSFSAAGTYRLAAEQFPERQFEADVTV